MTCRDVIGVLSEYLDATLDAQAVAELERHLQECAPCVAYLRTFRRTRTLAAEVSRVEMPPEMRQRLRRFLLGQLGGD
jgi:anti-sigma factor RsiW